MKNNETSAIILAAGKGTRMKSELPKVLHPVCGKPMILHIIDTLKSAGIKDIVVVVGHKAEMVKETVGTGVKYALQQEQKGTGHAVMQAVPFLSKEGNTLIITGDTPLIQKQTISSLIEHHLSSESKGTVLSTNFDNPTGYGRIVRNEQNDVVAIVEQKDASDEQKMIKEVNTGIFCFDNSSLINGLPKLTNQNAQNEFYLTDMVSVLKEQNKKFSSYLLLDNEQVMGINDREQLAQAEYILMKNSGPTIANEELNKKLS